MKDWIFIYQVNLYINFFVTFSKDICFAANTTFVDTCWTV